MQSCRFLSRINTVLGRQYISHFLGNRSFTVMLKTSSLDPVLDYFNTFHILFLKTFLPSMSRSLQVVFSLHS